MSPGAGLCALLLALALLGPAGAAGAAPGSLVPPSQRISDAEARRELARLLAFSESGRAEAMGILQDLLRRSPGDAEARLALAELLARAGDAAGAEAALAALPARVLDRPETQERLGNAYFESGRMAEAAGRYRLALEGGRPVLRRLAQALTWGGDVRQARPLLERLHAEAPEDREAALLLVRLRLADGDADGASALARDLAAATPDSPAALAELADVAAALGHAAEARTLYAQAAALPGGDGLAPRHARAMNLWGAFDRAIAYWRGPSDAGDLRARLDLALACAAAQRRDEAEGALRRILLDADAPGKVAPDLARAARLALARLMLDQERPGEALDALEPLLPPRAPAETPAEALREAVALAAQALARLGDPQAGLARLDALPAGAEPALRARLLRAAGRGADADALLARSGAAAPDDPELAFLALDADAPARVDALTASGVGAPRLTAWAALYAARGWQDEAIRCLRAALRADPEYFPARMALAESLAAAHRLPEALAELDGLAAAFPDSSKIAVTRARVLAWDQRYDDAQAAYAAVRRADPTDPVPVREAARVRFWAKERDQARAEYDRLLTPPVDATLAAELAGAADRTGDAELRALGEAVSPAADGPSWTGYEALARRDGGGTPPGTAEALALALADNLAAYRIQKCAGLEAEAKDLAFDTRFVRALPVYDELLDVEPGNQEARFDQGQAACATGKCSLARDAYERLLAIDPLNTMAGPALEQMDRRAAPSATLRHNLWQESGRGRLARILRQRTDLELAAPWDDDYRVSVTQHRWDESPRAGRSYEAFGQTLAFRGVFAPTLRGDAAWTQKRYSTGDLDDVDTGRVRLEYNADDWFRIGAGFERMEELANEYALRQRAASNQLFADLLTPITRQWSIRAEARGKNYDDANTGDQETLALSYMATDHPRQLTVTLSGERRDTQHRNQDVYAGPRQVDILHPYWTPKNYTAGTLGVEWRHDLAEMQFCGAPQNWYALRAAAGTDSEDNPSIRFEAEWRYELAEHWSLEARGLVHRSPEWDADGLWLGVGYGF
ncbi:MAG: tetratricopeptide repeat protein [Desulfovibrionaceae bacterium]